MARGLAGTRRSSFAATRLKQIQAEHGVDAIGGITSSRCTNEEVYVVQKMVRAAFGNNNVDTCARVCHSPTGYGLKQTFGTSAGTQDFASVEEADVILVIGANPTDAHPVFASRMKRRLREGAKLIVVDPRRIDLVRSPHVEAAHHLQLLPGTNVAVVNAMATSIVTEGLVDRAFVAERCEADSFAAWEEFIRLPENSPEHLAEQTGVPADLVRAAARPTRRRPTRRSTTASASPSTARARRWSWAWPTSPWPPATSAATASASTRCAARTTCRARATWARSRTSSPATGTSPTTPSAHLFEAAWGNGPARRARPAHPQHVRRRHRRHLPRLYVQGEDIAQSDPNTTHVKAALGAMDLVVVQDLFLNETANFAHVFLPGTSFLEKDGTFTNAERRINRVRPVMASRTGKDEWEVACDIATAMGYPMHYDTAAQIMDEIAALTPTFAGVSLRPARRGGQRAVAVQRGRPARHADHARGPLRPRARATSSRRPTCRPTSAPRASSRCSSPPAAS